MRFRTTSISIVAAMAVTGGAAFAQSGGSESFCAAGYSPTDANADGMIDQQELAKATEVEFSDLDANGDGIVSQEEYMDCRTGWMPSASVEQTLSEEDVTMLDKNQDGKIDQSEYMEAADQEYTARWSPTGSEKEVRDAEFAPATPENEDGDGNAQASAENAAPGETQSATETASAAGSAEADKAGVGDAGEPQGLILRRIIFVPAGDARGPGDMSRDEIAKRSAQKFLLLDADGNKVIAPEERSEATAANAIINQTINQQFDRADADKSGDISREEYTADAQARWEKARSRGDGQSAENKAGAPVVFFHYPHPM